MNALTDAAFKAAVAQLVDANVMIKSGATKGLTDALQNDKVARQTLADAGYDPDMELDVAMAKIGVSNASTAGTPKLPRRTKGVAGGNPTPPASNSNSSITDDDIPWMDTIGGDDDYSSPTHSSYYSAKGSGKASSWTAAPKCAHTHPLLTFEGVGTIMGGSCYSPQGDYDVEIGFDSGMKLPKFTLPWSGPQVVLYTIVDRDVPSDFENFDKLLDWTIEQMKAGKKVHCGCIGGHGRTGTFLAALVTKITGNKDSIKWVRENYCKKAVESQKQVNWLHDKYGITKQAPTDHSPKGHSTTKFDKNAASSMQFGKGTYGGGTGAGHSKTHTLPANINALKDRHVFGKGRLI